MRAAIYNSHLLPMGGSERVTLETISVLSHIGWDVDLYLIAKFIPSDLAAGFGRLAEGRCRFRMTKVPARRQDPYGLRRGGPYLELARNILDKRIEECDVFIDMVPFLSSHFALYFRLPNVTYWNLVPSDLSVREHGLIGRAYVVPLRVLARNFSYRWKRVRLHIANSEFTRSTIIDRLRADLETIVIYPPVDIQLWSSNPENSELRRGIVSLGRFEDWKRHDLQLKIARGINSPFRMIGRAIRYNEIEELRRVKAAAANNRNIEFYVNISQTEAKRILTSSKVFVHTADSEPFGISIVEAIAAGCIPIVRNNGGASEIVPCDDLRFDTIVEAQQKVRMALKGEYDYLARELKEHIQMFDRKEFRRKLEQSLLRLTSEDT